MNPTFFVAYLTANDTPFFHIDYFNLLNMFRHDPGVKPVHLYVGISEVRKLNDTQKKIISAILQQADRCNWIKCEAVILKPNLGRDFSSLRHCLIAMSGKAADEDFILVRNRSSRGPFRAGWYKQYVDQFNAHENTGMVGSTINLNDYYVRAKKDNASHVQTYAFLSKWKHLSSLIGEFPGMHAATHQDAILSGEIELSQRIMNAGSRISSLQKPGMILDKDSQNDPAQLAYVPELAYTELPIMHRKREIRDVKFWLKRLSYLQLVWFLFRKKDGIVFLDKTEDAQTKK